MQQPRPHGLLAVGGALTDDDSAAIELLARRLTNLRQLSGVDSLRMVRALPDGGYAIAQDMGGTFRVITHKPEPAPPLPPFDGLAKEYIPMLFSGVITAAVVMPGEGVRVKFSDQTRRRIANYASDHLPPKEAALQRFRIAYGSQFQEFVPQFETVAFYSQYAQQRPTWYSGAMAEVMQVVGGYGRQNLADLPDNQVERARLGIPGEVMKAIREQMGNVRLPGYTGLPNKEGQFQYDYKFNATNGVGFDADNKPWLLRIGTAGVWAMPLPLIPATTTKAFREYMEKVGDEEITAILDRFGGMPSGESFPANEGDFGAWRRAGAIIKVCDVADFYDHISYTSACGWSFNSSGAAGFNTCYDYYDAEGLGYGLAYMMTLNLAPAAAGGKLAPPAAPDDPVLAQRVDRYMASLYRLISSNTAESLAIKYKLRRVDAKQILERATGGEVTQAEVDYWNRLELAPIAPHSGSVKEVGRGYLYHGAKFMYQPQIKYPEPFAGGCVSHDFLPLENGRYKDHYPNCDTIMFGYYVGDELKVVKYFREERSYQRDVENDYEDCMIVGSWSQTETVGSTQLLGNFYTTDFDERQAIAPTVVTTNIVGKDLGYDSKPFFGFDAPFWRPGTLWRNRYFSTKTTVHRTEGHNLVVAICIPYLCRNAVLHALKETISGSNTTESLGLHSIQDPWSYRYWTYDFVMHWAGGLPVMKGKPFPKDSSPVWVEMENYDPSPCSDFADQGPWIPALPADFTWLVHPKANEWNLSGGGGPPPFKGYSTTKTGDATEKGNLRISILDDVEVVHSKVPDIMYFLGSPDPYVGVFYRDACKAVFGSVTYANVSELVGGRRARWGYTSLVDHQSAHHFIGSINE